MIPGSGFKSEILGIKYVAIFSYAHRFRLTEFQKESKLEILPQLSAQP